MSLPARSGAAGAAAAAAAACVAILVGLLPGTVSVLWVLAAIVAGALALMIVLLRGAVSQRSAGPAAAHDQEPVQAATDQPGSRLARLLFYAGCLLVCQSAFRYAGGLTISELLFIAAFGLTVLGGLRGQSDPRVPVALTAAVGVFVAGGAISSLDAQSLPDSTFQLVHAVYVLLLWPAVGTVVLRTREQVTTAIALWCMSAAIDGGGAVAQLGGVHLPSVTQSGSRMTGFTENPNDLGGACAVALVPSLMLATRPGARAGIYRVAAGGAVGLIAIGLMLSGSVSGMAAAAVAILIWLSSPAVNAASRVVIAALIVCALAIAVLAAGRTTTPVQRLTQIGNATSQNGGSIQDRVSIVTRAWPRIASDPFVGTGLDKADSGVTIVSHGYTTGYQIHGLPLAAWYQTGVVGMIGLMAVLAVLAATGWQGLVTGTGSDELLIGSALLAALIAFVVFAMTQPMAFQQYGWISAMLVVAWCQRRDRAEVDEPRGEAAIGARLGYPIGTSRPMLPVTYPSLTKMR